MKGVILFAALVACVYASAAFKGQQTAANVDKLELILSASSPVLDSADDQLLIDELLLIEKTQSRNFIENAIIQALNDFRDVVINGNEDLPPLDPLQVDHVGPVEHVGSSMRVVGNLYNFNLDGLRWYVVDLVNFNVLRLNLLFHLTIPRLTATGAYSADVRLGILLNHSAGGNFRIFINRFELGIQARLGTNLLGGHLILRELDIDLNIHDTQINIEGMTGSALVNGLINSLVQSITQDVIQSELGNVSQIISQEIFETINDILKDYTLGDILG